MLERWRETSIPIETKIENLTNSQVISKEVGDTIIYISRYNIIGGMDRLLSLT
jgi:hypothetical protein